MPGGFEEDLVFPAVTEVIGVVEAVDLEVAEPHRPLVDEVESGSGWP